MKAKEEGGAELAVAEDADVTVENHQANLHSIRVLG
jgi:hypothetical protein